MKTRITYYVIVGILISLMSCEKTVLNEHQNPPLDNNHASYERYWPVVIGAIVIGIIGKLAEGQAQDVQYHENGNLAGYSCVGMGTCHIENMTQQGSNVPFSSEEPLYNGDLVFSGFDLVKSREGNILFGTTMANPTRSIFFYNNDEVNITVPFLIDNLEVLEKLGESEPIEVFGSYQVFTDLTGEGIQYIKLK